MDGKNSIIRLIKLAHQAHPEMRICQLIFFAAKVGGWNNDDVFYCSDETLIRGLEQILRRL